MTPGTRYLRSRGIVDPDPGKVRWIDRADLEGDRRALYFPSKRYRGGGGWRMQRIPGGFPDSILGVLDYRWWSRDGKHEFFELEGILPDGTRAEWTNPDPDGKPAKRVSQRGPGIHGAAFVVRQPDPLRGGRLHVCEGAIDALSLDAMGHARPEDGIIAMHGCYGMRDAAPWCAGSAEVLIWPHHLDHDNVGERCADELAGKLGGRGIVLRSDHHERHDLNDELCELAPRRPDGTAGAAAGMIAQHVERLIDAPEHDDPIPPDTLPYLAAEGEVSVLAGKSKSGKSTWLRGSVADATRTGQRVLVVTEEKRGQYRRMLRRLALDRANVSTVYLRDLPHMAPPAFRTFIEQAVESCGAGTLIIDPWRRVLTRAHPKGSDGENDSGIVDDVVAWMARLGCAVAIVHHVTKWSNAPEVVHREGGDVFDAMRGSGALLAAVDRALVMFPENGDRQNPERIVKIADREERDSGDLRLTYSPATNTYAVRREAAPARRGDDDRGGRPAPEKPTAAEVLAILHKMPTGDYLSRAKVAAHWSGRQYPEVVEVLDSLSTSGAVDQHVKTTAAGERRYRYRLATGAADAAPSTTPSTTPDRPGVAPEPLRSDTGAAPNPTPVDVPDALRSSSRAGTEWSGVETDHQVQTGGGGYPVGGAAMQVAETEQPVETVEAADEQPVETVEASTVEAADEQPVNEWHHAPETGGRVDRDALDLEWSGAGAILDWRPGGPHGLTLVDIDTLLHPDALWLRDTPGHPDAGQHVELPNAVAYLRTLNPAELEQERKRLLDAKREAWRGLHAATMAQPYPLASRASGQPEQRTNGHRL